MAGMNDASRAGQAVLGEPERSTEDVSIGRGGRHGHLDRAVCQADRWFRLPASLNGFGLRGRTKTVFATRCSGHTSSDQRRRNINQRSCR